MASARRVLGGERQMSAKELITDRLPDLAACALLAVFGLAAVYVGASYPIGSITRMSAGFFPVAASVAVVGLAVAAALEVLFTERVTRAFKWRPLIFIAVAILAWTQLIDSLGIIPSTFALILISGMAKRPFHPISLLVTAAVLCLAGYLVFVMGLRMPLTALGR